MFFTGEWRKAQRLNGSRAQRRKGIKAVNKGIAIEPMRHCAVVPYCI